MAGPAAGALRRGEEGSAGGPARVAEAAGSSAASGLGSRRWAALCFIAGAQLMVALDATIVSIALPSAQAALRFSSADRQWVLTAYTMAFGGLLLAGGRIADRWGRTRVFIAGLAGFALASAAGGAAPDLAVLITARAVQGALAALLTPTALSLLAVSFTEPRERATAFAVYGGIAGSGAAIGLLLGGALTQYLDWRWCLFVNVPVALVAAAGTRRLVPPVRGLKRGVGLDLPGVAVATGALVSVVFGCAEAVSSGWGSPLVLGLLAGSGLLAGVFVLRERRARSPLLPLWVVLERTRGGACLSVLFAMAGLFGAFLFLTYYLQVVLGYTPLVAGLGFLPISVASQLGSWLVARRLMPRVAPRLLMVPGLLVAAAGLALLTQLSVGGGYLVHVLPAEALLGLGTACAMVPAFSNATHGVEPRFAGAASGAVSVAQQVGASVGTALLNSLAAGATAAYLATQTGHPAHLRALALVHGYATATAWGAGLLVLGALVAAVLIDAPRPDGRRRAPEPQPGPARSTAEVTA
jgi:EmrB/QacA subfamily drug resistance transporter